MLERARRTGRPPPRREPSSPEPITSMVLRSPLPADGAESFDTDWDGEAYPPRAHAAEAVESKALPAALTLPSRAHGAEIRVNTMDCLYGLPPRAHGGEHEALVPHL